MNREFNDALIEKASKAYWGVYSPVSPCRWHEVPEDMRRIVRNAMRAALVEVGTITRTEQAQESTNAPATFGHYKEPVKAQDGQHVLAHGHKCAGVDVEPNYAAEAGKRFRDAPKFTTSGKLFVARHLPMCANCNGTERVIEGGKQIDCPVCT
jgi:hypothetical protein